MRPTKGLRLSQTLLALSSLIAVAAAQALSIESNGCYWTSTVMFGNSTSWSPSASASITPSTTVDGQSLSPILTSPSSRSSPSGPIFLSTSTPASTPLPSTSIDSGTPPTSPTSIPASLTSSIPPSSSATLPPPVSTPFRVTVTGFGSKLRARALSYIGFSGENAYLVPNEELSAIFVLTFDGQLQTGDETVGTNGMTASLPLMLFPGPTQPSGYTWAFNGTTLVFGNTSFSALSDGQMFVIFPGSQPPMGAVQLGLEIEFVEMTSSGSTSSTSLTLAMPSSSSSMEIVTTPDTTTTTVSSSEAIETTSTPNQPISSAAITTSSPRPPQGSSLSTTLSSQMAPDSPLSSSVIAHTTAASSVQTSSIPASSILSSTSSQSPRVQLSPTLASSARNSATTMVGISSSVPLVQTTVVQVSTISQPSSTTRSPTSSPNALSSSSAAAAASSSSTALSPSSSPFAGTSVASPSSTVSHPTVSAGSSSLIITTQTTTTVTSGQLPSTLPSTSVQPSSNSSVLSSSAANPSSSSTDTSMTSTTRHSYTGPRTRSSSSSTISSTSTTATTTSSSSSNQIPTPYPAKRGLAYGNVTTLQFYPPPSPYIAWSYNYYSLPNASDNVGPYPYPSPPYRFIPLLYNDADSLTSIWSANVNFSIANYGTDAIFGFNEPDANFNGMSSNMPVARSIAGYQNFIQPFAARVKIGAPAVTNTGEGLTYLQQFLGNATRQNLTIDFVNIHWYASPYNIDYFKSFVTQAYNISALYSPNLTSSYHNTRSGGILPIWISEFGMDQNNYDLPTTVQFLKNAALWMDQQDWVERYAWFGNYPGGTTSGGSPTTNMLLNVDGSGRSALGDVWYRFNGTN